MIVDDYSRFTWVFFFASNVETCSHLIKFFKVAKNEKNEKIKAIRNDHGREFDFFGIDKFCEDNGIQHNFSALRTPQKNGVAEKKNRTQIETKRTLLASTKLPEYF